MEYEGRICRSPMERAAYGLPVAVGCSYNACRFCMLFKDLKYRELSFEQIEAEVRRVKALGGCPKVVFLGDGNAFGLEHCRLVKIMKMVRSYFPGCTFNMDATITNISHKSDGELHEMYDLGVRQLYLGIESGLDDVLRFMVKDHSLAEAYEQIGRIHAAGLEYGAHIMTGIAGKGRGEENALALAEFLRRTRPVKICNFSMFVHRSAPLYSSIKDGTYKPASELENLVEERILLENIGDFPCQYDGMHDMILFRVRGNLAKDRAKMIEKVRAGIEQHQDKREFVAYVR